MRSLRQPRKCLLGAWSNSRALLACVHHSEMLYLVNVGSGVVEEMHDFEIVKDSVILGSGRL